MGKVQTMNDISAIPLMNLGFEESQETDRYQIMDLICEGGMGRIYKAYDSKTDRYVAYKSVKENSSYQFELRFRYEAEVTARLEHPNIMPVYDIGQDLNGKPFYTMKLLKGKTLQEFLTQKPKRKELIEHLIKVCDAIAYSHKNNIIHRDLKPENIIIGDYGEVLVLDWGIAKVVDSVELFEENEELLKLSSDLTQCGSVMGTPVYMSPEQAKDAESADKKSDIYSLGAMFFKMLTAKEPFDGNSSQEILEKVKAGKLCEIKENIPASALAVCKKAMSLNPEERYQSVEEMTSELKKLQGGFTVNAENASLAKVLFSTVKRHKTVSLLSIVFMAILGTVITYNVTRIKEEKEIAQYNYQKAQDALNDLKKASPVYLDRAKHSIAIGKFDDAFIDIQTYLTLNNGSKEAYFLLGRVNQGQMKFEEAAKAFEKAQGFGDDAKKAVCVTSMEISKNAWSVCSADGRIAPDDKLNVYMALVNNLQLPEASVLLDDIIKDRKYATQVFDALFKNSGLKGSLNFTKSGSMQMVLDKSNTDLTVIRHFKKGFFSKLSIVDSPITNIESLSELKIRELDLSGTRVARLSQLKNPELQFLNMSRSRFQNLEDLSGRAFKKLDLSQCPLTDLSALEDIKAEELNLAGCPSEPKNLKTDLFLKFKKLTLPSKWKKYFEGVTDFNQISWSDLPEIIVQ